MQTNLCELAALIGLNASELVALPSGGGGLPQRSLEVDPYDFLLQAEKDFELGGDASVLNAITNAKRAIVSQMDQVLLCFGYESYRWNVPRKIEVLQSLGLVVPRILRRISAARNVLEHEYRRPSMDQIEEAIDLAALFISAVKPVLLLFPDEFVVGNASEQIGLFEFQRSLDFSMSVSKRPSTFRVWARVDSFGHRAVVGETYIGPEDPLFAKVVRLALAADRGFRLDEAIADFCSAVLSPVKTTQLA